MNLNLKKKFFRLYESSILLKFNLIIHKLFKEKDPGSLNFDFSKAPTRQFIVQNIISSKNYKSYLEIGCMDDKLFSKIDCQKSWC